MTVVDTITALSKARVVVDLDDQRRLVILSRRPLADDLARDVRVSRVLLAWAVLGRRSGHEWLACDRCGEAQLVRPDKEGRLCHLTPECKGHVRRSPRRLLDPRIATGWRTGSDAA